MLFFEELIEADLNPVITFNSSGRITYTNNEAQFLLSRIKSKDIFDLGVKYAPMNFGLNTSYVNLTLDNYTFYAITVGYKNEDSITVKLYKSIMLKKENELNTNGELTNIFSIVDLGISTQKIKNNIEYIKDYDPSIPQFKLVISNFLKLLNIVYESFDKSSYIRTIIGFRSGKYLKIEDKKYSLVYITIESDGETNLDNKTIDKFSNSNWQLNLETKNSISIDLPLVQK